MPTASIMSHFSRLIPIIRVSFAPVTILSMIIMVLLLMSLTFFTGNQLYGQLAPPVPENQEDFDELLKDFSTDNSESFSVIIKKSKAKKIPPTPPKPAKPPKPPKLQPSPLPAPPLPAATNKIVPEPPPPPQPQVIPEPAPSTSILPTQIYPNTYKTPPKTNPYKTNVAPNRYAINQYSPEDSAPLAQAFVPRIPRQASDYREPPTSQRSLPSIQKLPDPGLFPELTAPKRNDRDLPGKNNLSNSLIGPNATTPRPASVYRRLDNETLPDRVLIEGLYSLSNFEISNTHITPPFDETYFDEKNSYLDSPTTPKKELPVPLGTEKTLGVNPIPPYELLGKDKDSDALSNNNDFLSPPLGSLAGTTPNPLKKLVNEGLPEDTPLKLDDPSILDPNALRPAYLPENVTNRFIDPLFSDRYKNNENLQRILSNQPLPKSEDLTLLALPKETDFQTQRGTNDELFLLLLRARQLALARNYIDSLFLLRFVELKAPNNTLMLNMKGSVYYKLNRLRNSLAYWGRSLRVNPYQPLVRAYYNRVQYYLASLSNSIVPNVSSRTAP